MAGCSARLLVGQPLLEALASSRQVQVCDLNPDNIAEKIRGDDRRAGRVSPAPLGGCCFAAGGTVVNGTIDEIVKARPDTVFYGVTISGVACLTGLRQFCHNRGSA